MRKYYGYVRVSTARQGEYGVSLQEQRDAIARYSQNNQIEIAEWFEERVTAAKSGRPVFGDMLKRLRQGKAEGVVIHKIDRSARNLRDWANLGELLDQGIDVRFANESLDLNSRGGRLSADIQAVVASDYIRNLREETRKGFYGRLKQGYYPMPAPLGYVDNGGSAVKTICPVTGPFIRQAFELYATGKYTMDTLTETLYLKGLRTRRGVKVHLSMVSFMLNNPFYMGLIRIHKTGETFLGKHPPLVSTALFERVEAIRNGRLPKRMHRHDFLFRQWAVCAACKHFLIGERQKGVYIYYRCHTKACKVTCIREELIVRAVETTLQPLQFSTDERAVLSNTLSDMRKEFENERESLRATYQQRMAAIGARLGKLADAFMDGLIDRDLLENRKKALYLERITLEEKMKTNDEGDPPDRLERFLELAGDAYLSYKTADAAEKRDMLKAVSSNCTVEGKNVEVKLNLPFESVAARPSFLPGTPHPLTARTFLTQLWDALKDINFTPPMMPQERKTDKT